MAERPSELGDFKKARVNGGTDSDCHLMVIKQFVILGLAAKYRSRRWM